MKISLCLVSSLLVAGTAVSAPVTYQVDPGHTYPSFEADHFNGLSIWRGKMDHTQGTIVLDREAKSGTVDITVDASSIDFGHPKLNEHAKSPELFDVAKYPTITFKSKTITKDGDGLRVKGDLTIHGVTKEAVLEVEGPTGEQKDPYGNVRVGASATTKVKRSEHGLTWNAALETGGIMLGDDLKVELDVSLIKG